MKKLVLRNEICDQSRNIYWCACIQPRAHMFAVQPTPIYIHLDTDHETTVQESK